MRCYICDNELEAGEHLYETTDEMEASVYCHAKCDFLEQAESFLISARKAMSQCYARELSEFEAELEKFRGDL